MRKKPADDEVKAISVNTERELQQYFDSFQKTLIDTSADWNQRLMSLKQFQGLILGECYHMGSFDQHMINLIPNMIAQVNDLRSAIQKEACKSLVLASEKMGTKFENAALQLFKWDGMLHLLGNGKKILADTAHECIEKIITNVPSSQYFNVINDEINSKNNNVRIRLTGYLNQMLRSYENKYKEKNLNIIEGLIIKTCKDASSEVRANSRQAYNSLTIEYPELSDIIYQQFDNTTKKLLAQNTSCIPEGDSSAISGTSSVKKLSSSKRSLSYVNQTSAKSIRSNSSIAVEEKKDQSSVGKQEKKNQTPAQNNLVKSANNKNVRIADNRVSNSVGGVKRTNSVTNPVPAPKTGYSKVGIKSAQSSPGTSLSRPQTNQKPSNQNTQTTDEKSSFFKKTSQKLHQNRMNEIKVNDFSIDENQEYNLESVKSQANVDKIDFFKNESICDQDNQSSILQHPIAAVTPTSAPPTTLISNQLSLHLPISSNTSLGSQIFKNNILANENNVINQDSLFKKVQEDDLLLVTKESSDEDESKKQSLQNVQIHKSDDVSHQLAQINKFHSEELSFQGDFKPQLLSGAKQSQNTNENNLIDSNYSKETPTIKPSQKSPKYDFFTNQNAVVEFDLHHEDLLLDELNELNENSLENPKFLSQNFLQDDDYSSSQIQQEIRMLTYDHNNQEITPINSIQVDNLQFSHFNKNNSTNFANSQLNQLGSNQTSNNIIHPLLNLDKISMNNISQNVINPGTGRNSGSPVLILSSRSREKSISQIYEGTDIQGQKDLNLKSIAQSVKLVAQQRVQSVAEGSESKNEQINNQMNQLEKQSSKNEQNVDEANKQQDLERELKELTERQKQRTQVSEAKSKISDNKQSQQKQEKQDKALEKKSVVVDNDKNKSLQQRSANRSLTTSVSKAKVNSLSLKKEEQSPLKSKIQDSSKNNATPQTATQTTKQKTLSLSLKQTAQKQTNTNKANTSLAQSEVNSSKMSHSIKGSQTNLQQASNLKKSKLNEEVKTKEKNLSNKTESPQKTNKKVEGYGKSSKNDQQITKAEPSYSLTPNKNSQAINIIDNSSISASNSIITHPDNISTDKKIIKQSSNSALTNLNQRRISQEQEDQVVVDQLTAKSTKSQFILQQPKSVESQNTMISSKSQNDENKIQTLYSSNQDGSTPNKKSNQISKINQDKNKSPKIQQTQYSKEKSSPIQIQNQSSVQKQESSQVKYVESQPKQQQNELKQEQNDPFQLNLNLKSKVQSSQKQENSDLQTQVSPISNSNVNNQNNYYNNKKVQKNQTSTNQQNNLFGNDQQNLIEPQSQQNSENLKYITDQQNKLIQFQQQQLQQQQNQLLQLQQQHQQISLQQQQYQQQILQQFQQQKQQVEQQPQNQQQVLQNEKGIAINQQIQQAEQQQQQQQQLNNFNNKQSQYPSINNFESYLPISSYSNLNQIQQTNQTDYTNNNNYINRQLSPQSIHNGMFFAKQQNSYFPQNVFTTHSHKNSNELPQYNTQTFNNSLNNTRPRNWQDSNHERVNSEQFYQNQNEGEEFYQRQNYFIQQQLIQQQAQLKSYYEEMLANQYEKLAKGFQEQLEKSIVLIQDKIQSVKSQDKSHNEEQSNITQENKKKSKKKQSKSKSTKRKIVQNEEIFSEDESSENVSSSSFNMNKFLGSFNHRNKSQQIPSNSNNSSKNQYNNRQNWHQATKSNPTYSQNRLGSEDQIKTDNLQIEELVVNMNPLQIIKIEMKKLKSHNWATKLESLRRINNVLEQYEQIDDLQVIKNLIELTLQLFSTETNIQIIAQLLTCTSLLIQYYSDHYQNYIDKAVRLFIKVQQSKKQSISVQAEQILKQITDSYSITEYLDILLSVAISERGIENKLSIIQILFPVLRRNQIHLHEVNIIQQICLGMSTLILQNQEIKQIQMSCFAILNYTLEFGRDTCIESIVKYNSQNEDDLVNFRFLACIYSPQLECVMREYTQFNCLLNSSTVDPIEKNSIQNKIKQRYSPIRVIPTSESLQIKPVRKEGTIRKQINRSSIEEKNIYNQRNKNSLEQTAFLIDNFTSNENIIQENINEIIALITQSIQDLSQNQQDHHYPLQILEKLFQNQIYFHHITKTTIKKILNLYYFYPHNQMEFLELDEIVSELEYVQPTKKLLIQSLIEKIAEKTQSFQQGIVKSHFIKLLNRQIRDERNYSIIVENMEVVARISKKIIENKDLEENQSNKQCRNRALKCLSLLYFCDQKEMNQYWQQFTVNQQKEIALKIKEYAEKI